MSSAKSVLIGGGTGFIGRALRRALCEDDYIVTTISRMPGPQNISWVDLENKGLPPNTTAVVNLAGQNVLDPMRRWTDGFQQNVWNSRVRTTSILNKVIRKAVDKPKAFITISGVGIYPTNSDTTFTEDSPVDSFDYFSELAVAWENAAKLPEGEPVRQVTIRSGVVIGRNGGLIKRIYMPFFFGLGGPMGDGKQYMPWIHIDDLAGMFKYAIENNHVHGVMNGVAPEIVTNGQFTKEFAQALRRPAFIPLPKFVLNTMFGEVRAKMMLEGQKVKPKRVQELGFKYEYPDMKSALATCTDFFDNSLMGL